MNLTKEIKRYLRKKLNRRRYRHTLGVQKTARKLTKRHMKFSAEKEKSEFLKRVDLATLLHDVEKCQDQNELWRCLKKDPEIDHSSLKAYKTVWHAFCAASTAYHRFGIKDPDILNALRYHTTGRAGMSDLEKIIYLADYIEPGRSFPGVEKVRKAARQGINAGCLAAMEHTLELFKAKGTTPAPFTLEAKEDLINNGNF